MTWTLIAVFLSVYIASFALVAHLILRPGGLLEHLLETRGKQYEFLSTSSSHLREKTEKMESAMAVMSVEIKELAASTNRRLTSFETKFGKASRKEERERERQEALAMIHEQAKLQNQNNGGL